MTKEEGEHLQLINDITELLKHISPYGIWMIYDQNPIIINSIFTMDRVLILAGYLTDYGYAINRLDVYTAVPNSMPCPYLQLTDTGRELKALGSLPIYWQYLDQKVQDKHNLENDRKRDFQRNEYQFWVNVCIALATIIAALYYVWQFLLEYWSDYEFSYTYFGIFFSGIVTGIAIMLVIGEVSKRKKIT